MSDEQRCERCGWPLAASREEGCVPGDCSFRCDCGRVHRPGCPLYTAPPCKRCEELRAEVERLRTLVEVRRHSCECSEDEACHFVRQRDELRAHLSASEERVRVLECAIQDYVEGNDDRLKIVLHPLGA